VTSFPLGEVRKKLRVYAPFLPHFATVAYRNAFTVVEEAHTR